MGMTSSLLTTFLCLLFASSVLGENPYRFFTWNVTYGDIWPLGVNQQGILINGMFPGPQIVAVTNDNVIVNIFNSLTEPFLISWNGIQQRGDSWQDGVYGTNCPILPGQNFTYDMQFKDQIGSFFYFPSLGFHKAAGAFGSIKVLSRPMIPVPFDPPAGDFVLLIGDWFKANHTDLRLMLESGRDLPSPDRLLINGHGLEDQSFTVEQGKTYRFRISNVGLTTSLNIQFQGHTMKLVEVEGSHTQQTTYTSLDVHLGQSYSVLVTADQPSADYAIIVSTRFTSTVLNTTAYLHYNDSLVTSLGKPQVSPPEIEWSRKQALSIKWNLTASAARPNPQGSYNYGLVNVTRTIRLANSAPVIYGKQKYAVNNISFIEADTPLKLADFYDISGVFTVGSMPDNPTNGDASFQTSVMASNKDEFAEIVFENSEDTVQSWHIDGHSFWVVGMDEGQWSPNSRDSYNLIDAISRCTVQVYPRSWSAIYISLDNVGMWNVRSENWVRQYLGQQFYLRVYSPANSPRDENLKPSNALLCGRASGL